MSVFDNFYRSPGPSCGCGGSGIGHGRAVDMFKDIQFIAKVVIYMEPIINPMGEGGNLFQG